MIIRGFVGHCAGRQREIQPDSGKQPQGFAAPRSALSPDAGWMAQVLVSTRIPALLPNPSTEAIGIDPYTSRAIITAVRKLHLY
jgi:hypothetical protein